MITFEEYNLLESYIGQENFQILLEKNLGSKIDNDIKKQITEFYLKIIDKF